MTPPETRGLLARTWAGLPGRLRRPWQFMGRHYVGCAAVVGAMPRCDFSCGGCYLGEGASSARPLARAEVMDQLRAIRRWAGPNGNVQLTDGELTLLPEDELVALISGARSLGLVPMLMTHGETFRRKPGLLERLMLRGGLTEVSFHVDATMRGGRAERFLPRTEAGLAGLRAEFAAMIRHARAATGLTLEAASTVTVTRRSLGEIPAVARWFLRNSDAFKMAAFLPLASVGRTDPALDGVTASELWRALAEGTGAADLELSQGWMGDPDCGRFVQGLAAVRGEKVSFHPFFRRDSPGEMETLTGLLDRLGGLSFRLDSRPAALGRALGAALRHAPFLAAKVLPQALRLLRRAGEGRLSGLAGTRLRYFNFVSHHFMNREEVLSPRGRERVAACAFRVPVEGRMRSMCEVNTLGLRERIYGGAVSVG